jgi:polysaccharide biosynthesis/export protein
MEICRNVDSKKVKYLLLILTLLLAMLSSCVTNKSMSFLQEDISQVEYEPVDFTYYRLQPNDEIVMQVISINEEVVSIFRGDGVSNTTSISYRIYEDGTIDIPFISGIHIAGKTIREAGKIVESKVRDYAPDATVKIGLANDFFYFLTDVNQGKFPLYKEKLTIFQALAMAGNMPENADRKRVRIIRKVPDFDQPIIKEFDIRSKSIINSEYYYVQPNDILYVPSIKGDFYKITDYSYTMATITQTLTLLILLFGIF